jgi:hypothetical protein
MNAPTAIPNPTPVPPYKHTPLFPLGPDTTPYKKITTEDARVEKLLSRLGSTIINRRFYRSLGMSGRQQHTWSSCCGEEAHCANRPVVESVV